MKNRTVLEVVMVLLTNMLKVDKKLLSICIYF